MSSNPLVARRSAVEPVEVEWLTDPAQLNTVEEEWRALEARVQNRTVLSSFDFLSTWYRHYAGDYGGAPRIGLARRRSQLIGAAPLTLRRGRIGGIPVTRVDFAPNDSPAGAFLVEDDHPETIALLLDSLVSTVKFDVACLNGFDPDSPHLPVLREAAARRRLTVEVEDQAFAVADVRDGYDAYRRRSLSRNSRAKLKQKARRIEQAGEVAVDGVVLFEGRETIDDSVARMIAITEASYKLKGQPLADCHRSCLYELARRFGPRGMLSLSILSIGGRDAAFLMGLVEGGCFYDINLAYAEAFTHLAPGVHLMQRTLEKLTGAGVHTVVSHGAHDYKKHWATEFRRQTRVFLFAPGVRGAATRWIRFGLAPLWKRVAPPEH